MRFFISSLLSAYFLFPFFHFIILCLFLIAWYKTWRWDVLLRGFYPFSCVFFFSCNELRCIIYQTQPTNSHIFQRILQTGRQVEKSKMVWSCHFSINGCAYHFSFSFPSLSLSLQYNHFLFLFICWCLLDYTSMFLAVSSLLLGKVKMKIGSGSMPSQPALWILI